MRHEDIQEGGWLLGAAPSCGSPLVWYGIRPAPWGDSRAVSRAYIMSPFHGSPGRPNLDHPRSSLILPANGQHRLPPAHARSLCSSPAAPLSPLSHISPSPHISDPWRIADDRQGSALGCRMAAQFSRDQPRIGRREIRDALFCMNQSCRSRLPQ